jgi:mono/diheme cytochrome c family protein
VKRPVRSALIGFALTLAAPGLYAEPAYPQGAASFQANCAVCHGAAGAGLPSVAPPLLSYPAQYAASAEGRRQLAMTVLYGLFGEITVSGKPYDFRMPDFGRLDDALLAATLNFVVFDLGHAAAGVQPRNAPSQPMAPACASIARASLRQARKSC